MSILSNKAREKKSYSQKKKKKRGFFGEIVDFRAVARYRSQHESVLNS